MRRGWRCPHCHKPAPCPHSGTGGVRGAVFVPRRVHRVPRLVLVNLLGDWSAPTSAPVSRTRSMRERVPMARDPADAIPALAAWLDGIRASAYASDPLMPDDPSIAPWVE